MAVNQLQKSLWILAIKLGGLACASRANNPSPWSRPVCRLAPSGSGLQRETWDRL